MTILIKNPSNQVMAIKQWGFFYNVLDNDARLLNKYLGYRIYGTYTDITGFPVNGSETVFAKLDKLSIDYDVYNKYNQIIISKRFPNNNYHIVSPNEIQKSINAPTKNKFEFEKYIQLLEKLCEEINIYTGEIVLGLDDSIKYNLYEIADYFQRKIENQDERKRKYPNSSKHWSTDDDTKLIRHYFAGTPISKLSELFGRSEFSIKSRLLHLFEKTTSTEDSLPNIKPNTQVVPDDFPPDDFRYSKITTHRYYNTNGIRVGDTFRALINGKTLTYTIKQSMVELKPRFAGCSNTSGYDEEEVIVSNPDIGIISDKTPLAQAVLGKSVNESFTYTAPDGKKIYGTILEIHKN